MTCSDGNLGWCHLGSQKANVIQSVFLPFKFANIFPDNFSEMSFGPPPSQLCLLSHLPKGQVGDKVRFLGCVTSYSLSSGTLTLEHRLFDDKQPVAAAVDVNLVLESLGSEQTRFGEWVNVMGYITSTGSKVPDGLNSTVRVQAILAWSAGPLNLQTYEASVRALNERDVAHPP
ncbi:telomere capping, CST complex subunit-domain-containing protein [Cladorrhinum sp. PSN259]|nr:telomere capping, CST complex subunit-domain-containing protein [Cladorrhinum sp. PSN259]